MSIKRFSLSNRLLLAVSLVLTAFLGLSAFSLNNAFQVSTDTAQNKRLKNYVYSILSAAEFHDDGSIKLLNSLAEPNFALPNSGLYAQITSGSEILWQSPSSLGRFIALPAHPGPSNELLSTIELNDGNKLLNLAYGIIWANEKGKTYHYTINVSESLNAINKQKSGFQLSLWQWLGGTGLMLLIAQAFILRWGLRPLHDVATDLNAIETGDKQRLSEHYPKELNQLTRNINTLLNHEQSRRQRYKNSLADLAHSLKTPLAVIRGELESTDKNNALYETTSEQLQRLSELVDYQLQKAATEGKSSLQAPISLAEISSKIASSLEKVYQDKHITIQCRLDYNIFIHADEGDMYELLGNLLENAYKYCKKHISISIKAQDDKIEIRIDDDGNGIPKHALQEIIKRGQRVDSHIEGQGIGLAIVSDIIDAYNGSLDIDNSYLGGARFIILLPIQ